MSSLGIDFMLIIGLETSGFVGSIALRRDGQLLEERLLGQAGRRHAQSLVLELRELLHTHGATSRDVQAIAVSKGPGSFTGLRVGLVCAKTFAYATGCRFVAVDTFAAIAENCPCNVTDVWVVENAQRGDFFVGRYAIDNAIPTSTRSWRLMAPVQIVSADEWLANRAASDTITGPGLTDHAGAISPARLLTDEVIAKPRASSIARLGEQRLLSDATPSIDSGLENDTDFWKAVPFYFRPSAAEEQQAKRSGVASA